MCHRCTKIIGQDFQHFLLIDVNICQIKGHWTVSYWYTCVPAPVQRRKLGKLTQIEGWMLSAQRSHGTTVKPHLLHTSLIAYKIRLPTLFPAKNNQI